MSRALATIELIEEVKPIPDADAIEAVKVQGWWVVVRKDLNYRVGDPIVFFQIDSVLPDHPAFEEMLKGKPWSPRAARLKTIKLRGQISQGYVRHVDDVANLLTESQPSLAKVTQYLRTLLPGIENIEEEAKQIVNDSWLTVFPPGTDVTELIGVTKYEPPLPTDTAALAGHWIPGVPKTDEERVQNDKGRKAHAALLGKPYVITVKMDGMSGTFGIDADGEFWACSRNFRLKYDENQPHWVVANRYRLEAVCKAHPELYFQGEVCGPGIQGNRLGLSEPDLFIFNIWDSKSGRYLSFEEMTWAWSDFGLTSVPLLERGRAFNYTPEELLTLAEGEYPSGKQREGIVIRDPYGTGTDRISFKAISNSFLLSGGN